MKKLAVLFPGWGYGQEKPLLHYGNEAMVQQGYEVLCLSYDDLTRNVKISIEEHSVENEKVQNIKEKVLRDLGKVAWEQYDKIIFLSKSIGTVMAGIAEQELKLKNVYHIFLTPLPQTLPFFKEGKCKVIAGTKDKYLAAEELQSYCEEHGISYRQFEGVGHSMEDTQDVLRSLEIMKEIVKELYKEYGIKGE